MLPRWSGTWRSRLLSIESEPIALARRTTHVAIVRRAPSAGLSHQANVRVMALTARMTA